MQKLTEILFNIFLATFFTALGISIMALWAKLTGRI